MNNLARGWIYDRLDDRGAINSSFVIGVDKFYPICMFAIESYERK